MKNDCNFEFCFNKVTKEQVLNNEVVSISVSGYEVKELITDRVDDVIKVLNDCKEQGRGKLILTFSGYDRVLEEIYEIKEIRDYVGLLFKKYPHLFYFISKLDMNNKIILACLCDLETVYIGDEKRTLSETFYNNGKRSQVGIKFNISNELRTAIVEGVIDYAKSIDEDIKNTKELLENLFDLTPQDNNDSENPYSNIYEAFFEISKKLWISYVKSGYHKMFDANDINSITMLKKHIKYVCNFVFEEDILSTPIIVDKETISNLCVVKDLAYGPVCDDCSSTIAVIIKDELETDAESLDKMVFVPSWEYYINKNITPFDDEFLSQIPVPINPDKDMWYCPNCGKLHKFTYSEEIGLSY